MTKFVACVSGKGGVGKTITTINLGAALNYFNRDVTIVDANLTTPNIGLHLGTPVVPIHLHDVLQGKYNITEATYLHPAGIKVVPASLSIDDLKKTNIKNLEKALRSLEGTTDIVLVDTSAGLGNETLSAIKAVDEVLIITNPELPAITDALKTIKLAESLNKKVTGVILTKIKNDDLDISIKNITAILEKPIIGLIPEDNAVRYALQKKEALLYVNPKSPAAISYKKLAAYLTGHPYDEEPEKPSFFHRVLQHLGLR